MTPVIIINYHYRKRVFSQELAKDLTDLVSYCSENLPCVGTKMEPNGPWPPKTSDRPGGLYGGGSASRDGAAPTNPLSDPNTAPTVSPGLAGQVLRMAVGSITRTHSLHCVYISLTPIQTLGFGQYSLPTSYPPMFLPVHRFHRNPH